MSRSDVYSNSFYNPQEYDRISAPTPGYGRGVGGFITSPEFSQGLIGAGQAILNSGYRGDPAQGIFGFNEGMQKAKQQRLENAYKSMNAQSMLGGGATGVLIKQYMNSTGADFPTAMAAVKSNLTNQGLEPTADGVRPIPRFAESKAQIAGAEAGAKQNAQNRSDLTFKPAIAQQTDLAKTDADRQANLTRAQGALKDFEIKSNIVLKNIKEAKDLTKSGFATGYGSYLSRLPNTESGALQNKLDTIKANIGFDRLEQMRLNSPTGGALGNVSENENKLLQAVNGALDPKQEKNLNESLDVIEKLYPQVLEERKRAFDQDYGRFSYSQNPQNNSGSETINLGSLNQAENLGSPPSNMGNQPRTGQTKSGHKFTVVR